MNQLNSVIIEGNLVKKAELRQPKEGFKVCTFCVGVNRWHKKANGDGESEVSYFEVETFGHTAELCAEKGEKGREIRVVGRLKQDRWNDSNDKTKSRIYVVAEHIEFKPKYVSNSDGGTSSEVSTSSTSEKSVEPVETSDKKEPVTVGASGEAVNF